MNPTNDLELFNIFGTSLKAGKTKVTSKLCFYEACKAVVLEKEANVQILRNGIQDFARGRRVPQKSPFVLIFFFLALHTSQIFDSCALMAMQLSRISFSFFG